MDADQVTVNADVTIALPFLVTALATSARDHLIRRPAPSFDLSGKQIVMDGVPLPEGRFQADR